MKMRKLTCAAGGLALACAAAYAIPMIAQGRTLPDLDLRFVQTPTKADRLPLATVAQDQGPVLAFDLPSQSTTIVTRRPVPYRIESSVQTPRPTKVRTIPIQPVREVPNEEAKTERLPEGCEPAFSPVTTPAFAHLSVRCDS